MQLLVWLSLGTPQAVSLPRTVSATGWTTSATLLYRQGRRETSRIELSNSFTKKPNKNKLHGPLRMLN
jgi:hypothetical protein